MRHVTEHSHHELTKLLPLYPWCKDTATLATMFARDGLDNYWAVMLNKSNTSIKGDIITVRLCTG